MSRPSPTQSPCFSISRCLATRAALTPGSEAILEACSDTSRLRIASVTSRPSRSTRSPSSMVTSRARSGAAPSFSSSERATARYIAPESRYEKPSSRASLRATVLLPAPAGPSMATTMARSLAGAASGGQLRDERAQVLLEAGVRDGGRLHADDLDASPGGKPRDRAQHRHPVIAARVDRAALDSGAAPYDEAVR